MFKVPGLALSLGIFDYFLENKRVEVEFFIKIG